MLGAFMALPDVVCFAPQADTHYQGGYGYGYGNTAISPQYCYLTQHR